MSKVKKLVLCLLMALTISTVFVGCGRHVPTTNEVEKAYEKMQEGKISPAEYYDLWDAWNNGEKVGTPIIVSVGKVVLVVVVAGGVFKYLKNKKEKKDDVEE